KRLQQEITALEPKAKADPKAEAARSLPERRKERDAALAQIRILEQRERWFSHAESQACVDSELMLLWWDRYELRKWQVNLLYFQVPDKLREGKPPFVMVSRLDGPGAALAMKLVDQAIEVEKKGLSGKVYVDARGIRYDPKGRDAYGYGGYDESLREMARLLEKEAQLPV